MIPLRETEAQVSLHLKRYTKTGVLGKRSRLRPDVTVRTVLIWPSRICTKSAFRILTRLK